MKKIITIILTMILSLGCFTEIYADTTAEEVIKSSGIYELNEMLKQIEIEENSYAEDFDLVQTVKDILFYKKIFDLSVIIKVILNTFVKEICRQGNIMRNLIFIVCICALTQNLSNSFHSKGISEITFYSCYIVTVMLLIQSFKTASDMTLQVISKISELLNIYLPVLSALLVSCGNYTTASMFQPAAIFMGEVITKFVEKFVIMFIISTTMLSMINNISPKDMLGKAAKLCKKAVSWGIKSMCVIFSATLTLNKAVFPAVDGVVNKTAKAAVGAIPVIGDVMEGSVDIVMGWTGLVKNGVVLGVIIFMLLMCFIPVLKLLAMIFIYRFVAAVTAPLADKRLISCIEEISEGCQLLLGVLAGVIFIFIAISLIGISMVAV